MERVQVDRRKHWLLTAAKLLIVVLVVWFIRGTLVKAWQELEGRPWRFDLPWFVAAIGLYVLGTLPCGLFWLRVLRTLGQPVGALQAIRAYYIGHLGKYVPGKAMVVILRAGLVRGEGVDASLAAVSVFYETLTMMAVGAWIGAAVVTGWFWGNWLLLGASLSMMLAAGVPTFPPVFRRLVRWVGVGRRNPAVVAKLDRLNNPTMYAGWALTGIGWVIQGLAFWAVLRSCGQLGTVQDNPFPQLHFYTAAVSLATVAGFISLVPGGVVVREAVLLELMTPFLGDAAFAVVGAVFFRLVGLAAELILSAILYFMGRIPSTTRTQNTEKQHIQ